KDALPGEQLGPAWTVGRQPGQLALHMNELAARVVVVGQEVGIDQAQGIVVGLLGDGLQERGFVGHWSFLYVRGWSASGPSAWPAPVIITQTVRKASGQDSWAGLPTRPHGTGRFGNPSYRGATCLPNWNSWCKRSAAKNKPCGREAAARLGPASTKRAG